MRQLKAEYYKMKYSRASKWVLVFMAFIFFIPFVVGNDTLFMTFGDYRNIDSIETSRTLICVSSSSYYFEINKYFTGGYCNEVD